MARSVAEYKDYDDYTKNTLDVWVHEVENLKGLS